MSGSSMLNYMLYVRGHSGDYNEWRDLGLEGWGYEVGWQGHLPRNYDEMESFFPKEIHFLPETHIDRQ